MSRGIPTLDVTNVNAPEKSASYIRGMFLREEFYAIHTARRIPGATWAYGLVAMLTTQLDDCPKRYMCYLLRMGTKE